MMAPLLKVKKEHVMKQDLPKTTEQYQGIKNGMAILSLLEIETGFPKG